MAIEIKRKKVNLDISLPNQRMAASYQKQCYNFNDIQLIGCGDIVSFENRFGIVVDSTFSTMGNKLMLNTIKVSWVDDTWCGIDSTLKTTERYEVVFRNPHRMARYFK